MLYLLVLRATPRMRNSNNLRGNWTSIDLPNNLLTVSPLKVVCPSLSRRRDMTTEVTIKARTANVRPVVPNQCVYCCGQVDERVPLKFSTSNIQIGGYSLELAKTYSLPWVNERHFGGFEISAYKGGTVLPRRTWSIRCFFEADIPFCQKHLDIKNRIEGAADPGKWMILAPLCGGIPALLAAYGHIRLFSANPGWLEPDTLLFGLTGLFAGAGLGFLSHKIFDPPAPPEKRDYLKTSAEFRGTLGCSFEVEHKRSLIEFLNDPFVVVRCNFTNRDYAHIFAEANVGEVSK